MRISVVPGKLVLLIGKDALKVLEARFDLKNNIGIFPDAGDLQGKVLGDSRAGHLMVPLLPDSSWEFHDSFLPSGTAGPLVFLANVTNEAFSVKPLQGSRTIRDLMISSGKGSFQRLHRTFRLLRQKKTTASEHDSQVEKDVMENVVRDAEGSCTRRHARTTRWMLRNPCTRSHATLAWLKILRLLTWGCLKTRR